MRLFTVPIFFLFLQDFALVPQAQQILAAEKVQKAGSEAKKSARLTGQVDYRSESDARREEVPASSDAGTGQVQSSSSLSGKPSEGRKASPPGEKTGPLAEQSSSLSHWLLILANVLLLALLGERAYRIWRSRKDSATVKSVVNSLAEEQIALRKDVGLLRVSLKAISEEIEKLPLRLKTATENVKESPNEEYAKFSSYISKLVSAVEQLPLRVKQEIVKELDFRDQAREEEEAKRKSQAVCNELKTQTEGLRDRFPVIEIASCTRELLSSLKTQMKDWEVLARNYAEYLKLDKQWEELNNLQSKLSENPHTVQSELPERLNKRVREIESLSDALTKNHRTVWFTALLDEASRFPSEQEKTLRLKELLNLEEISLTPGQEIKNPRDVDVVGVEGTGDRTIVKEILQKGYQERTSGLVLKKPKISVLLE